MTAFETSISEREMAENDVTTDAYAFLFDVLPVRPAPETMESITSYINRLAEANSLNSFAAIKALFFPSQVKTIKRLSDFGARSYSALSRCSLVPESKLKGMTFHYLAEKFSRSTQPQPLSRFMGNAVSRELRWCPKCLSEYPSYYRLPWQFVKLTGCPFHGCYLACACSECRKPLKQPHSLFKLDACYHCGKKLKDTSVKNLTDEMSNVISGIWDDIVFLLSSWDFGKSNPQFMKILGQYMKEMRVHHNISLKEFATALGVQETKIGSVEWYGTQGNDFEIYSEYLNHFGITFQKAFTDCREYIPTRSMLVFGKELNQYVHEREEDMMYPINRTVE